MDMYASGHLAYVSHDFSTWEHIPVTPEKIGFAPSAVYHNGSILLTASAYTSPSGKTDLYIADTPLGPFKKLGAFRKSDGSELSVCDPMLFSDDDGSLYLYFGGGNDGIYGVKLRDDDPTLLEGEPVNLFRYDPSHIWERNGDYHENDRISWIEGGWMYKRNGIYYLVYCAPGTEYSSYSLGAYRSKNPLSGFVYQSNNPFLTNESSGKLIRGCGHGSVVDGPGDTIWAFYTVSIAQKHRFERMVGMDELFIDENGNLASHGTTEIPRPAPGYTQEFIRVLPLTVRKPVFSTGERPGGEAVNATEENLFCRWLPEENDPHPSLTVELNREYRLFSARLIFSDEGLNYAEGFPIPVRRFLIEARSAEKGCWVVVADKSQNTTENMIEYLEFSADKQILADAVRLTLFPDLQGRIHTGVRNFTVFGTP